jgi:transcriptional regulator with XRE-family HTH domain
MVGQKVDRSVEELRLERLRRRIPQRAIAAALGVSASVISSIENGWAKPRRGLLRRYRRALGLSGGTEAVRAQSDKKLS